MKNSLTAEQLELFGGVYGNELADRVASSDPASFATRVPSTWLELVAHPEAASIRAISRLVRKQLDDLLTDIFIG